MIFREEDPEIEMEVDADDLDLDIVFRQETGWAKDASGKRIPNLEMKVVVWSQAKQELPQTVTLTFYGEFPSNGRFFMKGANNLFRTLEGEGKVEKFFRNIRNRSLKKEILKEVL